MSNSKPSSETQPQSTPQPEPSEASAELAPAAVEGGLSTNVDAITELFSREPDTWTKADMERMVLHLRKYRVELETAPEKKARAKAAPKVKIEAKDGLDLLSKLGLSGMK